MSNVKINHICHPERSRGIVYVKCLEIHDPSASLGVTDFSLTLEKYFICHLTFGF